jgi:hypothetical protein
MNIAGTYMHTGHKAGRTITQEANVATIKYWDCGGKICYGIITGETVKMEQHTGKIKNGGTRIEWSNGSIWERQ